MPGRGYVRPFESLFIAAVFTLAACGSSSPPPATPASEAAPPEAPPPPSATPTGASPDAPETAAASVAAAAAATQRAPEKPKPARAAVPADSSNPEGVVPLSEAESKELNAACKKFTDVVAATAKKARGQRPIDIIAKIVANPPKIANVDVAHCAELMRRDTVAYLARTRESEARFGIKRILVGLMTALSGEPSQLCPSAPPVPASLDTVKEKPYESVLTDWAAGGWPCTRFTMNGSPQVFQYEVRTDAAAKSFEIIARGYPVLGAPPTELFVAGKVENGAIDPATPVMRR